MIARCVMGMERWNVTNAGGPEWSMGKPVLPAVDMEPISVFAVTGQAPWKKRSDR